MILRLVSDYVDAFLPPFSEKRQDSLAEEVTGMETDPTCPAGILGIMLGALVDVGIGFRRSNAVW